MLNWNVTISGLPANPANLMVAALYDPLVPGNYPGTPDFHMTVPKPGGGYTGAGIQITFINVAFKVYNFVLFESTDGTASGSILITPFGIQPGLNTAIARAQLPLIPGFTAGLTATAYVDSTLVGWQYSVEKRAFGSRIIGTEVAIDNNGFHLLNSGETIDDVYFLNFLPQIIPVNPTANVITSSVTISAAITLDSTYKNKAIYIKGASSYVPITLPDINSVSGFDFFYFYSAGGLHVSAPIICKSGDKFQMFGTTTAFSGNILNTKITLCQNECLKIFKDGGVWNVDYLTPTALQTGRLVESLSLTELNVKLLDGTLISRQSYSRLWDYVNSLPSTMKCADSAWNNTTSFNGVPYYTNNGLFTPGDGLTTFRIPLMYQYAGRRAVDGSTRLAGSFQFEEIGKHTHPINGVNGVPAITTGTPPGNISGGGHDGGSYPVTQTDSSTGNENRQSNTGVYLSILI